MYAISAASPRLSRKSIASDMARKGERSRVPLQTYRSAKASPKESTTVGSGQVAVWKLLLTYSAHELLGV